LLAVVSASAWNSLEVAKLVVSALTPIVLFGLGFIVSRAGQRVELARWSRQKVIERRLELFNEMGPDLNDLFCFFLQRGHFRDITPPDAIGRKRRLDRIFHSNRPLFSLAFADRYQAFLDSCFATFTGAGEPAKLRASADEQRRQRGADGWDPRWEAMFVESGMAADEIARSYDALMNAFAYELDVAPGELQGRRGLSLYDMRRR
jgi:hypothetical protein